MYVLLPACAFSIRASGGGESRYSHFSFVPCSSDFRQNLFWTSPLTPCDVRHACDLTGRSGFWISCAGFSNEHHPDKHSRSPAVSEASQIILHIKSSRALWRVRTGRRSRDSCVGLPWGKRWENKSNDIQHTHTHRLYYRLCCIMYYSILYYIRQAARSSLKRQAARKQPQRVHTARF